MRRNADRRAAISYIMEKLVDRSCLMLTGQSLLESIAINPNVLKMICLKALDRALDRLPIEPFSGKAMILDFERS
jgi:hypothetical protein